MACNISPKENSRSGKPDMPEQSTPETVKYTADMVVNKNDFACGMPVTAGINDTCHINNKAYGFCSPECKAEFMKDPNKYLTQK